MPRVRRRSRALPSVLGVDESIDTPENRTRLVDAATRGDTALALELMECGVPVN